MRWLVLVVLVLSAAGCRKKSAPEVYRLEGDVEVLVTREGDPAWESEEMAAVERQLGAIPADVVEAPRAQALLAKIQTQRARVKAEREALEAKPPELAPPPRDDSPSLGAGAGEAPSGDEVDAGSPVAAPTLGMSESAFLAAFGSCFKAGPAVEVPDAGRGSSHVVLGKPECEARFGEKGSIVAWVFVDGKLSGRRFEGAPTVEYIDAGSPPPKVLPPPPTPFDAGTLLFFPGAPRPENMEPTPGSPGSKIP